MKEKEKSGENCAVERKNTQPELDYDALWKEAKYAEEHKESER